MWKIIKTVTKWCSVLSLRLFNDTTRQQLTFLDISEFFFKNHINGYKYSLGSLKDDQQQHYQVILSFNEILKEKKFLFLMNFTFHNHGSITDGKL